MNFGNTIVLTVLAIEQIKDLQLPIEMNEDRLRNVYGPIYHHVKKMFKCKL